MNEKLTIRKVRTLSGATAVQVICYKKRKRVVVKHVGSGHSEEEIAVLYREAEIICQELSVQPSLFGTPESFPQEDTQSPLMHVNHMHLEGVTHRFSYEALKLCSKECGLSFLHNIYQDLALMRIIEPVSKLRTVELLYRYFEVSYSERTIYRLLPKLISHKEEIEAAAYKTAVTHFGESFGTVLYDVTTLYFESHEPNDDLRARGFSKDDKSKQPQIVVGLLVTSQGFPLMHEVYKGNKFEGHTMLEVVKQFAKAHPETKPIIVTDAAMLSKDNMQSLANKGYQYIVGSRLASNQKSFIDNVTDKLKCQDGATIRLHCPGNSYEMICTYSEKRARKDKFEFEKQIARANEFIAKNEQGKRAKFVKKSSNSEDSFALDIQMKEKAEKLIGIKGYCTNIPSNLMDNDQIVAHYQNLWHVEKAFRISKTDLRTRPIFHHKHEAIRAHLLICFMALMMAKFLEIKTGMSIQRVRDILWSVNEATIKDGITGKVVKLRTNLEGFKKSPLQNIFNQI